jgi:type III secretory pathway component EscU
MTSFFPIGHQQDEEMTRMLEKAFEAASKLPVLEQNVLARVMLDEIASEQKWDALFAESEDVLALLAAEALQDEEQGKTREIFSQLP